MGSCSLWADGFSGVVAGRVVVGCRVMRLSVDRRGDNQV